METGKRIIIYTDGGARGNPGPAAIGFVIEGASSRTREYSEQIGNATNNVAEYRAVIAALKKIKHLLGKEKAKTAHVEIRSDSELVVRQMNAEYKIKGPDLQPLFIELWNLKQDFGSVEFTEIPREKNRAADRLVNRALDTLW